MTTFATRAGQNLARTVSVICVFLLVLAAVLWWIFQGTDTRKITAYFDQTIGVYAGSTVRVLGVEVGTIDDIVPMGTQVKVDMSIDRGVNIPANAQAVVVAPSVVSDRYVQLAPVYTGGPTMGDNAVIPRNRTATPVELDQLYDSLNKLATSLGPNGANSSGALSNLLNTAAANLNGNGENLHDTITQLSQLSQTLDSNKNNLFATVDNLAQFTTTLANSDATVRQVTSQLSDVSGFLADERGNLGAAVSQLSTALGQVQSFISNNRSEIKSNVDNLTSVTQVLVNERSSLAEVLDDAPLALTNVVDSYNAASGSLDTRTDINDLANPPAVEVCHLLQQLAPGNLPADIASACSTLAPLVQGLVPLPSAASVVAALQQGKLPPLPLPLAGVAYASPSASGSTSGGGQ
ncbi:MAG TPA: MCE family protein [Pseudonocardiaceae bacterium]|jgi:virulence factor Mce-like protein|nr:MCE family protein [Pseudonocardiaceae bacterium]